MFLIRQRLHTVVLLGMMPLAVFSGISGRACYCADGHFKLFCAGDCTRMAPKAETSHCCSCGQGAAKGPTSASDDCCSNNNSQPCGKCCQKVFRVLGPTVASVAIPSMDVLGIAMLPPEVVIPQAFLSLRTARMERVDSGPPDDIVIAHHCLLI
jgi:hypothetical protein